MILRLCIAYAFFRLETVNQHQILIYTILYSHSILMVQLIDFPGRIEQMDSTIMTLDGIYILGVLVTGRVGMGGRYCLKIQYSPGKTHGRPYPLG